MNTRWQIFCMIFTIWSGSIGPNAAGSGQEPNSVRSLADIRAEFIEPNESVLLEADGKEVFVIWTAPMGVNRVFLMFAVYSKATDGWLFVASGTLDRADKARASFSNEIVGLDARTPGKEEEWERRLSIRISNAPVETGAANHNEEPAGKGQVADIDIPTQPKTP